MPVLPNALEAPTQESDGFTRNQSHVSGQSRHLSHGAPRPRPPKGKRRGSLIEDFLEYEAAKDAGLQPPHSSCDVQY